VISEAVAREFLPAPRFFEDPLVRRAYLECSWTGPVMGQLNPLQEIDAAIKRVQMTVSTLEEETAEISGGEDWDQKVEQRGREQKKLVALGLTGELTAERIVTEPVEPVSPPSPDEQDLKEQQEGGNGE
jgi:capsid protein